MAVIYGSVREVTLVISNLDSIQIRLWLLYMAQLEKLLWLYRTLIRSKLDYGSVIYGSVRASYIHSLDPIHNQGPLRTIAKITLISIKLNIAVKIITKIQ